MAHELCGRWSVEDYSHSYQQLSKAQDVNIMAIKQDDSESALIEASNEENVKAWLKTKKRKNLRHFVIILQY